MISFITGTDWIAKLWIRLKSIRKNRQLELEEMNTVIFGDPVEIAKYYVEPDCQERNTADRSEGEHVVSREPVMKKIDQFFSCTVDHHGENQLFFLSDAGMGKTALLTMLKLRHLTAFWPLKKGCVLKKLGKTTLDEVSAIKNKMETILLLDSLDEDATAYGRVKERLLEILESTQHFFRVIITCRTQFFPKLEEDLMERLGWVSIDGFNCPVKYLSFFDDEMVTKYLNKRFPKKFGLLPPKKEIEEARKVIEKMGYLRCRPMLLSYIENLMKSPLIKEHNNEYRIYDALIQSWLYRDQQKIKEISVENLLDACIILAVYMQVKGKRSIDEEDLNCLIDKIAQVKPVKRIEVKGRSLLNLNSKGEYRFSHYSIQEFLVAKLLLEKPIYKLKQLLPVTDFIFRMITLSKKSPNFIKLLDFKGLNLSDAKLENIKMPGADFSGIDFSRAKLSGCDFCNADFSGANLEECTFKDCKLEGTKFTDANSKGLCLINTLEMRFIYIIPGEFMMGSPENEPGRFDNETRHRVILTEGFFMQTTPLTQGQWKAVMGNNPSHFENCGDDCPVENVSWDDAQKFIDKLNQRGEGTYRLPTEAEWEYAARAGSDAAYCFGDNESEISQYAWYDANSESSTHPVGKLEPNNWGLYDMHGNVWEWCHDRYGDHPSGSVTDPMEPDRGSYRVCRGGSWHGYALYCRSARRIRYSPDYRYYALGFRPVLLPGQQR